MAWCDFLEIGVGQLALNTLNERTKFAGLEEEGVQDLIVDTSVCVNHAASTRKLRRCCAGVL